MYKKVWNKCQASVCAINFYSARGIRINSISGFKYGKYLITDDMVYKINRASEVQISFMEDDGLTVKTSVKITDKDFRQRMVKGVLENLGNFALINIDFPQFDSIPSLVLSSKATPVATPIAVIGYSKDNMNMAIKMGYVSSYIKHNNTKFIQFDAALEFGNSGSPLIDAETCEVVGIVGHRISTFTDTYNQMMNIINNNLELLQQSEGKVHFNDIDPIQVLVTNQNQIKHLAQVFFKNSSIGYGFALEVSNLVEYLDLKELVKTDSRNQSTDDKYKIILQ